MASAGELCDQCFAGSLQLHEGMLVCDVCGSIHQGFAEETQEFQTGISDARFFKKSEGMKSAGAGALGALDEPPPPPPVGDAVQAYIRALQALLQRQAAALVAAFGMDAAIRPVLRELWLAFLAGLQLLEPSSLVRLQALAEQGRDAGGGSDDESTEREGRGEGSHPEPGAGRRRVPASSQLTHDRLSLRIERELGPKLRPQHTLALLLLACWQQGEAASPLDMARWALDGHLPYLSFPAEEGAALQQYSSILGRGLVTPRGVPSPRYLLDQARQLAQQLGLACPPLSPTLWLERYLAELELPQALLPIALQLHMLYQPSPLLPTAPCRVHRHPWAMLVGSLLLAVKLCYGLDGEQRSMAGLPPAPDWQAWAQRQLSRLGRLSAFPLSLNEAAQLDEPGLRSYLQYLQRGLLASFTPPAELESMHRLFLRLASLPADGEDLQPAGGGSDGSAPQAHGAAGAVTQADQPVEYCAPGLAPSSYLHYGAAPRGKALFHPDYALLVTACSPLVWLTPEALHELLAGLECSMIGAECEVSFLYNAEEQARLARVLEEGAWLKRQRQQKRRGRGQQEPDAEEAS
ncbi:hypothetical protein ABPG77_008888 [Micractinium sp. CCAP 211/92]